MPSLGDDGAFDRREAMRSPGPHHHHRKHGQHDRAERRRSVADACGEQRKMPGSAPGSTAASDGGKPIAPIVSVTITVPNAIPTTLPEFRHRLTNPAATPCELGSTGSRSTPNSPR